MVFSSIEFIFRFIPIFLLVYYITPKKVRTIILFLGSIIFYLSGELKYWPLLFIGSAIAYLFGIWIEKINQKKYLRILLLLIGISYYIGSLLFFKVRKVLPLGISFYTFTMISYLVDVYQMKISAERNPFRIATYLFMFPQLISGPIVRYDQIEEQIKEREYTVAKFESGLKIFIVGLGYKVILADQLSTLWNGIQTIGFESISSPLAWLGVLSYSLQLYFDFNGYSLMALGVGGMLGFTLPINFAHPYMSRSVSEFWRRWHITLGQWFRDYVYIPLGGNRHGLGRQLLNLFIVWICTGLWHGTSLNFILWGVVLFLFIALEKIGLQNVLARHEWLSRIYLLITIGLTWMIFAITDLNEVGIYFTRLFPFITLKKGIAVNTLDVIKYLKLYGVILGGGIFFSTPIAMRWYIKHKTNCMCLILLTIVFWYSVYLLTLGNNNPFMYFRF